MSSVNLYNPNFKGYVSKRNNKVAANIRQCLANAISRGDFQILPHHEHDSRMPVPVTITYVDLSPDLRNAVVYFIPFGGEKKDECLKFFRLQTHFFKNLLAKKMKLRYIPEILFKIDTSFEYSEKIEHLLDNVKSH